MSLKSVNFTGSFAQSAASAATFSDEKQLPAYEQVMAVFRRFVGHFSQVGHTGTSKSLPLTISPEEKELLKSYWKAKDPFAQIAKGSHNTVLVHPRFPNCVFKPMAKEKAEKQWQVGNHVRDVVHSEKLDLIQVPSADMVNLDDNKALYIEQKMELGLDDKKTEELWLRLTNHFNTAADPIFEANMKRLFDQSMTYIIKTGYWDVGAKNFPEFVLNGKMICGVDFENVVDQEAENKEARTIEDLHKAMGWEPPPKRITNIQDGLVKLAQLCVMSPKLQEAIEVRTQQAGLKDTLFESELLNRMIQRFSLAIAQLKAIQALDIIEWGFPEQFAFDAKNLTPRQSKLAQHIIEKIKAAIEQIKNGEIPHLSSSRLVFFQPSFVLGPMNPPCTREEIAAVLNELQDKKIGLSWGSNSAYHKRSGPYKDDLSLIMYNFYF